MQYVFYFIFSMLLVLCYHAFQTCTFLTPLKYIKSSRTESLAYPDEPRGYVYRIYHSSLNFKSKEAIKDASPGGKEEEIVTESIRVWAEQVRYIHMFILTGIKYQSFVGKDSEDTNGKEHQTRSGGDHDVVLVCEEIGIIFVQVKGITCEDSQYGKLRTHLKKAAEQLYKDKMAFMVMSRGLTDFPSSQIPIKTLHSHVLQ